MAAPVRPRRLGPEGPAVFPVGLGAMPLSLADRPTEAQAIATIHAALDAGMALIDTADVYCLGEGDLGHNERLVARALAERPGTRDRVLVATKGGLRRPEGRWTRDARPEALKAACEASLRALGVEAIALYQLHAPDPAVSFLDSVGALADLRKAGKILRAGLSNVSASQIALAQKVLPIASVQNRFSPFFRESEKEGVIAHCAREGIAFLAYSPLGGGRLNRTLPAHPAALAVARRHGTTPHAAVLAWVLSKSPAVIPIPGASRPESARGSAAAAALRLSDSDLAEIEAAAFPAG